MSDEIQAGFVRWFNTEKGYGFVGLTPFKEPNKKDIFLHGRNMLKPRDALRDWPAATPARFRVRTGPQGTPEAYDVEIGETNGK